MLKRLSKYIKKGVFVIYTNLIILFLNNGCKTHVRVSFSNDLENLPGWFENKTLNEGSAHSGKYFSRTDSTENYSITFSRKLKDISTTAVRRIDAGVWFRIPDTSAMARFVVSIEKDGRSLFWAGAETKTADPLPGDWTRLYVTYDLPESFDPEALVKVYLWNESKKIVDTDDFDIHFYLKED